MDKFENYAENNQHVEENVKNCDKRNYVGETEEVATQEGVQVEDTALDSITAEAGNVNQAFVGDDAVSTSVTNEKIDSKECITGAQIPTEDIGTDLNTESTTYKGEHEEEIFFRENQEQVLRIDLETDQTKKRLRKKKRRDRENAIDTENGDSTERPRRRKKKKRKSHDTVTETNHVANSVAKTTDTRPPLSPSHDAGYDSLASCFKGSNNHHSSDPVIDTQNAHNNRHCKPREEHRTRELSSQSSRMDIFTVQGVQRTSSGLVMGINEVDQESKVKKKKKKKKLHGLKKTKGAVGILPPAVDPDVASVRKYAQEEKPNDTDKDGDAAKLVTDEKETTHPTPILLCRIIAGFPVTSFRKHSLFLLFSSG